jgi:hypothetical protein
LLQTELARRSTCVSKSHKFFSPMVMSYRKAFSSIEPWWPVLHQLCTTLVVLFTLYHFLTLWQWVWPCFFLISASPTPPPPHWETKYIKRDCGGKGWPDLRSLVLITWTCRSIPHGTQWRFILAIRVFQFPEPIRIHRAGQLCY